MSSLWQELREFERRLKFNDDRLLLLERRARALRQNTRDIVSSGIGGSCLTTLTGTLRGCLNTGLAGARVNLIGQQTATDYGTFTATSSGTYSAQFVANETDTDLDAYVDDATSSGRFDSSSPASGTTSYTPCTVNSGRNWTPSAGTGYACDLSCNYPIGTTWTGSDSLYGAFAPVYAGGGTWIVCHDGISYPGGFAGCGAVTTAIKYVLFWDDGVGNWFLQLFMPRAGGGSGCPVSGNCAAAVHSAGGYFGSHTCPNPATATNFSISFTIGDTISHPGGATVTISD
jgi:hypothetical protein